MRIFTITMAPINPPYDDGAKNIVMGIARRIKEHCFYFVASHKNKFSPAENIIFIWSPFQKPGKHSMSVLQKLYVFLVTIFIVKKIDVFQFFFTPQPYFSGFYRKFVNKNAKKSIQIVTSVHTLLDKNMPEKIPSLFFADRVIVHSDYAKQKLRALGIDNVTRIYPGVETDRFKPVSCGNDEYSKKTIRIVYPGTYKILNDSYSFEELLNISLLATKKIKNIEFVMACRIRTGEDAMLRKKFLLLLKKSGIENFILLNTINDMPSLFNSCTAGIMPMRSPMIGIMEIPLVLLELSALGKPVIYGDIAPMDELDRHGIGIRVIDRKADTYADNLIKCVEDKGFYSDIGRRSQDAIKKDFTMDTVTAQYEKLYSDIGRSL